MTAVHHYRDPGEMACAVDGCDKARNGGATCSMHAMRKVRTGSFDRAPILPLRLDNMVPLGINITALRYQRAMGLHTLAHKAQTTAWTLGNISRGESCTLDLLWRIGAVFDVEAWRLLKPGEFPLPIPYQERCR